jgi:hypothetical protein
MTSVLEQVAAGGSAGEFGRHVTGSDQSFYRITAKYGRMLPNEGRALPLKRDAPKTLNRPVVDRSRHSVTPQDVAPREPPAHYLS